MRYSAGRNNKESEFQSRTHAAGWYIITEGFHEKSYVK